MVLSNGLIMCDWSCLGRLSPLLSGVFMSLGGVMHCMSGVVRCAMCGGHAFTCWFPVGIVLVSI